MPQAQFAIFIIVFVGLTTTAIVLPLTLNRAPTKAPIGFRIIDPAQGFIQKVCTTEKDWTSELATNERQLSNEYFDQPDNETINDPRGLNTLAVIFGQFLDHDITLTETDPDAQFTIEFLNVTRTIKDPITRETKTLLSPGIDGSTIYGDYANAWKLQWLRVPNSCLMKTSVSPINPNVGPLLPLNHSTTADDFMAGDERSDEHSTLTAIHTLFAREHNRLCNTAVFPADWTEEEKFWKVRQTVIAIIHRITFYEWLPALFGTQSHLLNSNFRRGSGHRMVDVFAGAAFRFGHSMIPNRIGAFHLMEMFFNISMIQTHGIDYFIDASAETPAQKCDLKVVNALRNVMFASNSNPGEDLVTRNLFRGRDIGLPTYEEICICYQTPIIPIGTIGPDPEDPMIGLLNEPLVPGSSLPRTIATILAEQFNRLRDMPELDNLGEPFQTIARTTTIGSLIRRNTNITKTINFFL